MYADMRLVLSVISYDSNERMIGGSSKQGGGFFWGVLFSFLYFFGGGFFFQILLNATLLAFARDSRNPFFFLFLFLFSRFFFWGGGFLLSSLFCGMQRNFLNAKRKIYLLIPLSRFSAGDFTLMLRHNAIGGHGSFARFWFGILA